MAATASAADEDPRALARSLRELIEGEAAASDAELTLSRPVIDAITRTRLFHLMVPRDFGGAEADSDTILDVFEELAYADGSIGWTVMANASATSYVSFLDPAVGAEMVKGRPESTTGGQFSPFAKVERESGGYRVSGRFQFGSGTGHATYVGGAGFALGADGNPEILPSGLPAYVCFFVPQDGVSLNGGWDVMGLRGTGSYDYEVKEQSVAAGFTFYLFNPEVRTGGALYGLGARSLAGLGHAGWGLGVAQRALDEITKIADAGRARLGATSPLADQQVFQRGLGEKTLALHSVRLLAHDVFGRMLRQLEEGRPIGPAENEEISAVTAYLTEVAMDVTLFAYRASGSQGLRNPSILQRCFRDLYTGGQHLFVDPRSYETHAQQALLAND
jgi:alkylation response protein AidB-like acyl-CoA dehydrogenase